MTRKQSDKVENEIVLLTKEDIKKITQWGKSTIDNLFANDENFPAIKIGKTYLVEVSAFKEFLSSRRVYK